MSFSFISKRLEQQQDQHLRRQRQVVEQQSGRYLVVDGKRYLNFSSNDYLGLNHHPQINKALQEGADKFGTCASASSLVTGFNYAHQALEDDICQWLNKPKVLLFNSGFAANYSVLHLLASQDCSLFLDKLSHASLIDGAFSGKSRVKRFAHNDQQQLESFLAKTDNPDKLIVSEGIFSMDGDGADVMALSELKQQYDAKLYLDEAHSIGVIGDAGQGSSALSNNIDIVMATCGKALATQGAFIALDDELHDYLVNFSREYIYSTAMSPAIAWATKESIKLAQQEKWRREKIVHLSEIFSSTLDKRISLIPTCSSIHALVLGEETKALSAAEQLKSSGIWLTAIRPPTVAKGSSRLRVTINASHKEQDIKHLAESINRVIN